jgi:hypothetical protein
MYTHMARRDAVSNEEFIKSLIRLHQSPPSKRVNNKQVQNKILQLRASLRELDPAIPKNRATLAEYSTTNQGKSSYTQMQQNLDQVLTLLPNERGDASLLILNFLVQRTDTM